jgi:maltose O-acetyltransferase
MDKAVPFEDTPWYALAASLPKPVKKTILASYWPLKALVEDFQDYTAEVVGHVPLHAFRLWWFRHICRVEIGAQSSIHRKCRMYRPNQIVIGDHSVINYGVLLDGRGGLNIGDNVSISEGTIILTMGHDIDAPDFRLKGGRVMIDDYVFIGSYTRILPGVTVGEGAVVGVGSVVTKDVDPYTVVGGVPARYIRDRSQDLSYQLHHRKRFG